MCHLTNNVYGQLTGRLTYKNMIAENICSMFAIQWCESWYPHHQSFLSHSEYNHCYDTYCCRLKSVNGVLTLNNLLFPSYFIYLYILYSSLIDIFFIIFFYRLRLAKLNEEMKSSENCTGGDETFNNVCRDYSRLADNHP